MHSDRTAVTKRLSIVFAGLLASAALFAALSMNSQAARAVPPRINGAASSLSEAFRETSRALQPSVVAISTESAVARQSLQQVPRGGEDLRRFFEGSPFEELFQQPELRRFYRPSQLRRQRQGIGSGVVIDESGLILTNNHVIRGSDNITVKLSDGREFRAIDVKTDPKTDLAVLKIEASNLVPARLGDSDQTEVGDWVLALGQPFGLQGTVTAGIISAKGRGIGIVGRENFLQTDAAINPGNSGGPLVNLNGEVVGINTAISSASGGNDGIGFAIPVNLASWVSQQLVSDGVVHRSFLGVGIQQVTHDLAEQFGIQANEGVVVTEVLPDSPAHGAGIQSGDVILTFGGESVQSPRQLQNAVERSKPGSSQPIELLRSGRPLTVTATCAEQPQQQRPTERLDEAQPNALGLEVNELSADVATQLGVDAEQGVVITHVAPGSRADKAGLTTGVVVIAVNRRPVSTTSEFEAVTSAVGDEAILLLVRTSSGSRFVVLPSTR